MRQVREALRLQFEEHRSQREIALSLGLSQSTTHAYLRRFEASSLAWPLPLDLDDAILDARVFRRADLPQQGCPVADWATVHHEVKKKRVTLHLL